MLFADHSALVAHIEEDMQLLVDRFADVATTFSLKIKIKKGKAPNVYQPVKNKMASTQPALMRIHVEYETVAQCVAFKYLGSTVYEKHH